MTLLDREGSPSLAHSAQFIPSPSPRTLKRGIGDDFAEAGFVGPLRVLAPIECRRFLRAADQARLTPPLDWDKGHAVTSRAFYEIAT